MNFFQRNKIIIRILAIMLIITVSALGTIVYQHVYPVVPGEKNGSCEKKCNLLSEELSLSPEQTKKIDKILAGCRQAGMMISDSLREKRSEILTELSRETPDSIHLQNIANEIGRLQSKLTNQTISQYLQISSECTPAQRVKLSSLYSEMMGCCKQGDGRGIGKRCM